MERTMKLLPACDKRHDDPSRDHGAHGAKLQMTVEGGKGSVQFVLDTNWYLPYELIQEQQRMSNLLPRPEGVYTFEYDPVNGGEYLINTSNMLAWQAYEALLNGGFDGAWKILEDHYNDVFLGNVTNIKDIRIQLGMTQKDFAEYFNISVRTLQDWETNKRTPPEYALELIKYKIEKEKIGMFRLTEMDHAERKILLEGNFAEIVRYLRKNENLTNWFKYEDPDVELPDFSKVQTVQDLKYELSKIDLSWWRLKVEKIEP